MSRGTKSARGPKINRFNQSLLTHMKWNWRRCRLLAWTNRSQLEWPGRKSASVWHSSCAWCPCKLGSRPISAMRLNKRVLLKLLLGQLWSLNWLLLKLDVMTNLCIAPCNQCQRKWHQMEYVQIGCAELCLLNQKDQCNRIDKTKISVLRWVEVVEWSLWNEWLFVKLNEMS